MTTETIELTTYTLDVQGATITYDIRRHGATTQPPLVLIGLPMGAAGFGTLASHFADRTVVTYDPRGTERSAKADPAARATPLDHAEDVHSIIEAVGGGPVDLFGSSGGAITGLALVANHPQDVRNFVAHEPPLATILPDREQALAVCEAINATYQQRGWGAGMAHFIATVSHRGPFRAEDVAQPAPDPGMFGMPSEDDGTRTDAMLGEVIITTTHFEPDLDKLRAASTRIVPAAGVGSEGEMANRGAHALAGLLGLEVAAFPGDHGGFMGGEYGQTGEPEAFAATLRDVLGTTA